MAIQSRPTSTATRYGILSKYYGAKGASNIILRGGGAVATYTEAGKTKEYRIGQEKEYLDALAVQKQEFQKAAAQDISSRIAEQAQVTITGGGPSHKWVQPRAYIEQQRQLGTRAGVGNEVYMEEPQGPASLVPYKTQEQRFAESRAGMTEAPGYLKYSYQGPIGEVKGFFEAGSKGVWAGLTGSPLPPIWSEVSPKHPAWPVQANSEAVFQGVEQAGFGRAAGSTFSWMLGGAGLSKAFGFAAKKIPIPKVMTETVWKEQGPEMGKLRRMLLSEGVTKKAGKRIYFYGKPYEEIGAAKEIGGGMARRDVNAVAKFLGWTTKKKAAQALKKEIVTKVKWEKPTDVWNVNFLKAIEKKEAARVGMGTGKGLEWGPDVTQIKTTEIFDAGLRTMDTKTLNRLAGVGKLEERMGVGVTKDNTRLWAAMDRHFRAVTEMRKVRGKKPQVPELINLLETKKGMFYRAQAAGKQGRGIEVGFRTTKKSYPVEFEKDELSKLLKMKGKPSGKGYAYPEQPTLPETFKFDFYDFIGAKPKSVPATGGKQPRILTELGLMIEPKKGISKPKITVGGKYKEAVLSVEDIEYPFDFYAFPKGLPVQGPSMSRGKIGDAFTGNIRQTQATTRLNEGLEKMAFETAGKTKQGTRPKWPEAMRERPRMAETAAERQISIPAMRFIQKETQQQKEGQKQIQRNVQKQEQKNIQMTQRMMRSGLRTAVIPVPSLRERAIMRRRPSYEPAYDVYTYVFGKPRKLTERPLRRPEAMTRGARYVDVTPAGTFRLVKAGSALPSGNGQLTAGQILGGKFRPRMRHGRPVIGDIFVEKTKYRIDTAGEKRKLREAKAVKNMLRYI